MENRTKKIGNNMSTHALASLTATYTDSEPEGEEDETSTPPEPELEPEPEPDPDPERKSSPEMEIEKDGGDSLSASMTVPQQEVSSTVAKLVSYHDDNVISDEEIDYMFHRAEMDMSELNNHVMDSSEIVELPPEPTGRCSPRLIEKVIKLHEKIESGLDMNNMIQSRKDFRNPSIYEKLIQFCGLNELGTNYSPSVYDPLKWGKESFYEELAKVQKIEMDKREKEKKERTKVEFVSGTKKTHSTSSDDDLKKRKSKWDQVGAAATSGITLGMIKPAGLLQPSLTTSVTGTKGTVISAFGSLPKKPRL